MNTPAIPPLSETNAEGKPAESAVRIPSRRRFLAALLYESLVIFAVFLIGYWLPQTLLFANGLQLSAPLQWLHVLLLLLWYFVWFWLHGGQTLPMKTWRLRLVNNEAAARGSAPRPLQAVLRYLASWLSLACCGLGFLWILVDRERRTWHDIVAGTRIVWVDEQN